MAELLSVRFSKIGHTTARLDGLAYDMTGDDGSPENSMIIASNASGKTSQLHLLYSIFLPAKHDLATHLDEDGRSFPYYFQDNEVGFVVTEWTIPGSNRSLLGGMEKTRVVGRFTQYSNRDEEKHETYFFSFIADEEAGIDDLPLTSSIQTGRIEKHCKTISETKKYLNEVFNKPGREFYCKDVIREWQANLQRIGFNIDQFKMMMKFTLSEGDSSSFLKKFKDNDLILDFLCGEVIDKKATDQIRRMLSEHRESVRLEPEIRAQFTAFTALLDRFALMKPVADSYKAATTNHDAASRQLQSVASRLDATKIASETQLKELIGKLEISEIYLADSKIGLEQSTATLCGVQERMAFLSCLAADDNFRACEKDFALANRTIKALEALLKSGEVDDARATRDQLLNQLGLLDGPVREKSEEVAMASHLLDSYLRQDYAAATVEFSRRQDLLKNAEKIRKELEDKQRGQSASHNQMIGEKEGLNRLERERTKSVENLIFSGILKDTQDSVGKVLAGVVGAEERLTEEKNRLDSLKAELDSRLSGLGEQLKGQRKELTGLETEKIEKEQDLNNYLTDRSIVSSLPGIRSCFEQYDEADLFYPGLNGRLNDRYDMFLREDQRVREKITELNEKISAIEAHGGLQPPAQDVIRVIETLAKAGIEAFSWWQIFSERNYSVTEANALITLNPPRYGGVAVKTKKALDNAREILGVGCGVLAPVIVSVYTDDSSDAQYDGLTVLPDVALAIDIDLSKGFCDRSRVEIAEYEASLPLIRENKVAANTAKEKLTVFLDTYSEVSETALKDAILVAKSRVTTCQEELIALQAKEHEAIVERDGLKPLIDEKTAELRVVKEWHGVLSAHQARHEQDREERLLRIEELASEIAELSLLVTAGQEAITAADQKVLQLRDSVTECRRIANDLLQEFTLLDTEKKVQPDTTFTQLATSSKSARELRDTKQRALEAASTDKEYITVKANADISKKIYEKVSKEYHDDFGEVPEDDKQAASVELGGRLVTKGDISDAQTNRDLLIERKGQAKTTQETAQRIHNGLKKKHHGMTFISFSGDDAACIEQEIICNGEITRLQELITTTNNEITEHRFSIDHCKGELKLISSLADSVSLQRDPGGEPFASIDEAETELHASVKQVKTFDEELVRLEDALKRQSRDLGKLLDEPLCASVPTAVSTIKEEKNRREDGILRDGIDELMVFIRQAADPLPHELTKLEQDKQTTVDEVMHVAKKGFKLLQNLGKKSKIPELGGIWHSWFGLPFVRFTTRVDPDSESARLAVAGAVTRLAQMAGELPNGAAIVRTALAEMLSGAFQIETLKPDPLPTTKYYPISHKEGVRSWSGGQKLSGSVLLYMAFSNLLMTEGQAAGGVLLMDNPFGSCNHIEFVRLIVALTRQYGVQMIAYTPVVDEEIRRMYRNNVLLRKGGMSGLSKRGFTMVQLEQKIYNNGETARLRIKAEVPNAA
jgi:hypothetical protein